MKILKFGGTSLANPTIMKSIVPLIQNNGNQFIILSAIAGTTNKLVEINSLLKDGHFIKVKELIDDLRNEYRNYINELLNTEKRRAKALFYLNESLDKILHFATYIISPKEERITLAQGELLSTFFFKLHLEEEGLNAVLLPALDFMCIDEYHEPASEKIKAFLETEMQKYPETSLFISQGFICRNHLGEIDNLKRGGSDYTASLVGAALLAQEIQIWTDIDGMQNNDPRYVQTTKSISNLSFDEAAELAYFGAKILHPTSILPAKKNNIPVRLKNTLNPTSGGTLISNRSNNDQIKAIAAKDGIVAIKIRSARMLMAYGFLKRTFEVFEKYKTSVDTVTTSEVAISLTIDDPSNLPLIEQELSSMSTVEIHRDLSIICIVGDFLAEKAGCLENIFKAMVKIPIRMVSYGGSKNNVSLLVKTEDKQRALIALNEALFNLNETKVLEVANV